MRAATSRRVGGRRRRCRSAWLTEVLDAVNGAHGLERFRKFWMLSDVDAQEATSREIRSGWPI